MVYSLVDLKKASYIQDEMRRLDIAPGKAILFVAVSQLSAACFGTFKYGWSVNHTPYPFLWHDFYISVVSSFLQLLSAHKFLVSGTCVVVPFWGQWSIG